MVRHCGAKPWGTQPTNTTTDTWCCRCIYRSVRRSIEVGSVGCWASCSAAIKTSTIVSYITWGPSILISRWPNVQHFSCLHGLTFKHGGVVRISRIIINIVIGKFVKIKQHDKEHEKDQGTWGKLCHSIMVTNYVSLVLQKLQSMSKPTNGPRGRKSMFI